MITKFSNINYTSKQDANAHERFESELINLCNEMKTQNKINLETMRLVLKITIPVKVCPGDDMVSIFSDHVIAVLVEKISKTDHLTSSAMTALEIARKWQFQPNMPKVKRITTTLKSNDISGDANNVEKADEKCDDVVDEDMLRELELNELRHKKFCDALNKIDYTRDSLEIRDYARKIYDENKDVYDKHYRYIRLLHIEKLNRDAKELNMYLDLMETLDKHNFHWKDVQRFRGLNINI